MQSFDHLMSLCPCPADREEDRPPNLGLESLTRNWERVSKPDLEAIALYELC